MKLKKRISLILAICMIISLLPAMSLPAAAAGVKKISTEYNFTRAAFNNQKLTNELGVQSWDIKAATNPELINREVSTGKWKYVAGMKYYNDPENPSAYIGYFNFGIIIFCCY